jgi:hypothetical protein
MIDSDIIPARQVDKSLNSSLRGTYTECMYEYDTCKRYLPISILLHVNSLTVATIL